MIYVCYRVHYDRRDFHPLHQHQWSIFRIYFVFMQDLVDPFRANPAWCDNNKAGAYPCPVIQYNTRTCIFFDYQVIYFCISRNSTPFSFMSFSKFAITTGALSDPMCLWIISIKRAPTDAALRFNCSTSSPLEHKDVRVLRISGKPYQRSQQAAMRNQDLRSARQGLPRCRTKVQRPVRICSRAPHAAHDIAWVTVGYRCPCVSFYIRAH